MIWWLHHRRTPMKNSLWYEDFNMTIANRWYMLGLKLVTVSAEGRVEHQKLNQTTALLLFGWVFGVQLNLLENKCPIWREKPCTCPKLVTIWLISHLWLNVGLWHRFFFIRINLFPKIGRYQFFWKKIKIHQFLCYQFFHYVSVYFISLR